MKSVYLEGKRKNKLKLKLKTNSKNSTFFSAEVFSFNIFLKVKQNNIKNNEILSINRFHGVSVCFPIRLSGRNEEYDSILEFNLNGSFLKTKQDFFFS